MLLRDFFEHAFLIVNLGGRRGAGNNDIQVKGRKKVFPGALFGKLLGLGAVVG